MCNKKRLLHNNIMIKQEKQENALIALINMMTLMIEHDSIDEGDCT